ncbi:uncharacterized protein LOC119743585 [Patiria miniata]|uniref:Integrase catalytic domain-containing protein n=1 Tax=Patiria miniata TaxID=46514 RepID=A0A914BJ45_PATMI|nr:uncharacterized protein LOC119743585 [Patiria miniata]
MLAQRTAAGSNSLRDCHYQVAVEDFWDVISSVHASIGHLKTRATYNKIKESYTGVPEKAVEKYIQLCLDCQLSKQQVEQAPIMPIVSKDFMERGQLDLVDFSSNSDCGFKYVAHFIDHFSKFSVIWPLRNKCCQEVADTLRERVFCVLGLPRILHTDNGGEFVGQAMELVVNNWPGKCTMVRGRPHHPQSQGCVERGNRVMKGLIRQHQITHQTREWVRFLPDVAYQMNSMKRRSINQSAMEVVFGLRPEPGHILPGSQPGVYNEDDLPQDLVPPNYELDGWANVDLDSLEADETNQEDNQTPRVASSDDPIGVSTTADPVDEVSSDCVTPDIEGNDTGRSGRTRQGDMISACRAKARHALNKQRVRMRKQDREKKTTQTYKVGDLVTVKVPPKDRPLTGPRRLIGRVIASRGKEQPRYQVGTEHGVLCGWLVGSTLQKYTGSIDISKWDNTSRIKLRTAARRTAPPPIQLPTIVEAPTLEQHIAAVMEKGFTRTSCGDILQSLENASFEVISSTSQILDPALQPPGNEPRTLQDRQRIGLHGDGFSGAIPSYLKGEKKLVPVEATGDNNCCLLAACSLLLWGTEEQINFLRLGATLKGARCLDSLVQKVLDKHGSGTAGTAATAWMASVTTDVIMDHAMTFTETRERVKYVIQQEICRNALLNRDAGPLQVELLSMFLGRAIEVHCVSGPGAYGTAAEGDFPFDRLQLLLLPYRAGGQQPNHFVPLVPMTQEEQTALNRCGAKQFQLCQYDGLPPCPAGGVGWLACDICLQWYHSSCVGVTQDAARQMSSFSCGCSVKRPYTCKQ